MLARRRDDGFADGSRTPLILDVSLVFVSEIADGTQHRIGRRSTQRTKRPILHSLAQFFKEVDIRLFASALANLVEDVANVVVFLCSEKSRHITGEVVKVDGGQYI